MSQMEELEAIILGARKDFRGRSEFFIDELETYLQSISNALGEISWLEARKGIESEVKHLIEKHYDLDKS